jgi:hypothetical protein
VSQEDKDRFNTLKELRNLMVEGSFTSVILKCKRTLEKKQQQAHEIILYN